MSKIGIIDSGVGGFSLLKELASSLGNTEFYYIADSEFFPYGNKSQKIIVERMKCLVDELLKLEVSLVVIACNSATTNSIDSLRKLFDISFVGVEPYVNYINHREKTDKKTLMLTTTATFHSDKFRDLKNKYDPDSQMLYKHSEFLASIIERAFHDKTKNYESEIIDELNDLIPKGDCEVVLGCTHYPLIKNLIESYFSIKTIDPSVAVVRQVKRLLNEVNQDTNTNNQIFFKSSPDQESFTKLSPSDLTLY